MDKQKNPLTVKKWGEKNAPCVGCTLRSVSCHGDCPKDKSPEYDYYGYAAFKAQNDKEREARREYLQQNDVLSEIHRKRCRSR